MRIPRPSCLPLRELRCSGAHPGPSPRAPAAPFGRRPVARVLRAGAALLAGALVPAAAAEPDEAPLPERGPGVVVWLRGGGPDAARLDPERHADLRRLARSGVAMPRQRGLEPDRLLERLDEVGQALGPLYRVLRPARGASALAALRARWGDPPPVTDAERAALRRLRKARGAAEVPASPTPGASDETSRSPAGGGDDRTAAPDPSRRVSAPLRAALADGARLVVVAGGSGPPPVPPAAAHADTERVLREVFTVSAREEDEPPDRTLILVLLPEGRAPSLLVAGPGVRKARVLRAELGAGDIATGVRRLLALPRNDTPAGSAGWVSRIRVEARESGGGR